MDAKNMCLCAIICHPMLDRGVCQDFPDSIIGSSDDKVMMLERKIREFNKLERTKKKR